VPVFANYSIVEWHRCALLGSRYGHTPLESCGFSLFLLLLVCVSFTIIGQPRNSVFIRIV